MMNGCLECTILKPCNSANCGRFACFAATPSWYQKVESRKTPKN